MKTPLLKKHLQVFVGMLGAALVLPAPSTQAQSIRIVEQAACDYASAADLFHRSLCRCRRGGAVLEEQADRLVHAAEQLEREVRRGRDPRRVFCAYDEVRALHLDLEDHLITSCHRPDPYLVQLWRPVSHRFSRLSEAISLLRRFSSVGGGTRGHSFPSAAPPSPWSHGATGMQPFDFLSGPQFFSGPQFRSGTQFPSGPLFFSDPQRSLRGGGFPGIVVSPTGRGRDRWQEFPETNPWDHRN